MAKHHTITDAEKREIKQRVSESIHGISDLEREAEEDERALKLWNALQDDNYDELISGID